MSEGVQLVLWIAGVHLIGFLAVAALMLPALRQEPEGPNFTDENDDGWGRRTPDPPSRPKPPRGGLPLPDAVPASVRLRDHSRLGDRVPTRERRPVREPAPQPVRVRQSSGELSRR